MGHMFHFHMYGATSFPWTKTNLILQFFLSEIIMQKGEDLPERWELVTGGGFSSPADARSTRRQTVRLYGNHEEADTRLILHSRETASEE